MEEDETYPPSPPSLSIKARRRHAIITRDDLAPFDTALASPRRPVSSAANSLKLAFPELLLKFPCPPTSEFSLSPGTHLSGMPLTPDSDLELPLPSPRFNPRRAAIQSLMLDFNHESVDSDEESDSEWYHKEFSKLIESPCLSPQMQLSRPDSIFLPSDSDGPTTECRLITSDTVCPRRRKCQSRNVTIPKYPPPVPTTKPPRTVPCPSPQRTVVNFSRPPPRSSIPADCVIYMDGCDADSDSSSAFSFTIDFGERRHDTSTSEMEGHILPWSPRSTSRHSLDSEFGQEIEVDLDDARFELD